MLGEAGNDHPDDSFEIRERLFRRCPPSRPAAGYQRRTISVPAVIVWLDYDFEGVSGQLVTLPLGVGVEVRLSHYHDTPRPFQDGPAQNRSTHGQNPRAMLPRPPAASQPAIESRRNLPNAAVRSLRPCRRLRTRTCSQTQQVVPWLDV